MDPMSVAALSTVLSGVLGGATGEAGARAVTSLGRLLRRLAKRDEVDPPAEIERMISAPQPTDVPAIAEYLSAVAHRDPELASQVGMWIGEAQTAIATGPVTNSVSGTVIGSVTQAGVIHTGRPDSK